MSGDLAHQRLVADLVAKAADHGGDLGVEHRFRQDIALDEEDFQILAGGVKDLDHAFVAHQLVKRIECDVAREGIDQNRLAVLAGQGHLDQAKLGIIGPFAQELGVDGDIGFGPRSVTEAGEVLGRGDGVHADPGALRGRPALIGPS